MKAASEIFKLASKLNIKPKDIIGMGGDIVKMGQSLFTEKVNPKLLNFIKNKGDVPKAILEEIKLHIRTLKNASDNQVELFKLNLNDIVNAKFPPKADVIKLPVASDKKQATIDNGLAIIHNLARKLETKNQGKIPSRMDSEAQAGSIAAQIQDVTGKTASELNTFIKSEAQLLKILNDWNYGSALTRQKTPITTPGEWARGQTFGTKEYYLAEIKRAYPNVKLTGQETKQELKEMIYRLDTEGIPFSKGGIANHFRKK